MRDATPPVSLGGLDDQYVLTVKELAAILKINRPKGNELLATGEIEGCFRVGRCLRIQVKDVKAWIATERLPKNRELYGIQQSLRRRNGSRQGEAS